MPGIVSRNIRMLILRSSCGGISGKVEPLLTAKQRAMYAQVTPATWRLDRPLPRAVKARRVFQAPKAASIGVAAA